MNEWQMLVGPSRTLCHRHPLLQALGLMHPAQFRAVAFATINGQFGTALRTARRNTKRNTKWKKHTSKQQKNRIHSSEQRNTSLLCQLPGAGMDAEPAREWSAGTKRQLLNITLTWKSQHVLSHNGDDWAMIVCRSCTVEYVHSFHDWLAWHGEKKPYSPAITFPYQTSNALNFQKCNNKFHSDYFFHRCTRCCPCFACRSLVILSFDATTPFPLRCESLLSCASAACLGAAAQFRYSCSDVVKYVCTSVQSNASTTVCDVSPAW